jgi:hypothetical protein
MLKGNITKYIRNDDYVMKEILKCLETCQICVGRSPMLMVAGDSKSRFLPT